MDKIEQVPVCVVTMRLAAAVVISRSGSPFHFRVLLRVDCPYCGRPHIHGAGRAATAYWRVPHCQDVEGAPYVLRVRAVDMWLIFGWLGHDDRSMVIDSEGFIKIEHTVCDNLAVAS